MGCPLPVVTTACAGQVECKRLVNTDAIEWSVAMQMGGQVHAITHIAPFNGEARNNCPYFSPRQHKKIDRKASFDGIPRKILKLLIEQFDRVVYILEKETHLVLSENALRGMLQRYKVTVRPTHLPDPDAKGDGVHLI